MHKTVSVSIGSSLFVIEESAYARLDAYLKAIRAHFDASDDADEIVSDIEERIGEELSATLSGRKKVIHLKDVETVIASMGTVEDFREFDAGSAERKAEGEKRSDERFGGEPFSWKRIRLYRDADDQILGGVAAGIANYFGIDPLIVRILFLLSLFAGGFGVILYIVLWVILPEARTTAQKVEMTGGRVTLQAIQERIDENLPPEKRRGMLRKIVAVPVVIVSGILNAVLRIVRFILPLVARIVGAAILIGASVAIAGATFITAAMLLNPSSPYIGLPLRELLGVGAFLIFAVCGYFIIVLPLIILILAGASLVSLRKTFSWPGFAGLLSNWLLALVILGVTAFTVGPGVGGGIGVGVDVGTGVGLGVTVGPGVGGGVGEVGEVILP